MKKGQSISEEVKKLQKTAGILRESQLNEVEDLLSMLRGYVSDNYTADQGWGEDVQQAEADMQRVEVELTKMKGHEYFENLKDFARLSTYSDEYASPEESAEIEPQLEELAQKLGYTVDQLRGMSGV